jgi:hypothetical protein
VVRFIDCPIPELLTRPPVTVKTLAGSFKVLPVTEKKAAGLMEPTATLPLRVANVVVLVVVAEP